MTIYLIQSRRDHMSAWVPESYRNTEPASEQWVADQRLRTGGLTYRVVAWEGQAVPSTRVEAAMGARR
jgi:hypothetical protein